MKKEQKAQYIQRLIVRLNDVWLMLQKKGIKEDTLQQVSERYSAMTEVIELLGGTWSRDEAGTHKVLLFL